MKHLYVVAHAQSRHHLDGVVGGWHDTRLTDLGVRQAERIGQRLAEMLPAGESIELFSSDLLRASQTAEAIGRRLHLPIQSITELREKSYGEAGGKLQSWLDERFVFPPKTGNRMDHHEGIAGAETRRQFGTRIYRAYRAMDQILASPCAHQIIVMHGFALTFVIAAWINMPLDAAGHIAVKSTSGGITRLVEDDVFHNRGIVSLNDISHLDGLESPGAT